MAPSHPSLKWPRSDGDPSLWPQHVNPGNSGVFYKLPRNGPDKSTDEQKIRLYRDKVGKYVAEEVLNLSNIHNPQIDMPDGYQLFVHCKPQPDGKMREDVYMFGSKTVLKFRSPKEFFPHAKWLFSNLPLNDHTKCECLYNRRSAAAQVKAQGKKRISSPTGISSPDPKRLKALPPEHDSYEPVVAERATDIRTKRRFRKGELVFARIPTIAAPAGSGFPDLTHWPGLVASIKQKQVASTNGSASGSSISTHAPKMVYEHHVRLLGMFDTNQKSEIVLRTSELLPWAAGEELMGGSAGWDKIGTECSRVLREGVAREASVDIPAINELSGPALEMRWKKRHGVRIAFEEMPRTWNYAVLRLGTALKTAKTIASFWSQTDKMDVLPPGTQLSEDDILAIKNREKTLFQGCWFQGERIWVDDMVRLRINRRDLPKTGLLPPSDGAEERGVFLKIGTISMEKFKGDERPPSQPADQDLWRCMLYGDIFELAVADSSAPQDGSAPKGYMYRKLTGDFQASVDIFDLAGRAYPDLLDKDAEWFRKPGTLGEGSIAGDRVFALMGLRPQGNAPRAGGQYWKEDLYIMVRDATQSVEREMREHYARLLSTAVGYNPSPSSGSSGPGPGSSGSGSGSGAGPAGAGSGSGSGSAGTVSGKPQNGAASSSISGPAQQGASSANGGAKNNQAAASKPPAQSKPPVTPTSQSTPSPSVSVPSTGAPAMQAQIPSAPTVSAARSTPNSTPVPTTPGGAKSPAPVSSPDVVLVLPFTPAILKDPDSLMTLICNVARYAASQSVTILFSTPGDVQFYSVLLKSPRTYFNTFQRFLCLVYTALARGQIVGNKIKLDVEVHFEGEAGKWTDKIPKAPTMVVKLKAWPTLGNRILASWPQVQQVQLATPSNLPTGNNFQMPQGDSHYLVGAVGGTFDHLHAGHKLLLHMALFVSKDKLIVGVTDESMVKSKSDAAFRQSLSARIDGVKSFLFRYGQDTKLEVVPIQDSAGPTATDPSIEALIVSTETRSGADAVNKTRKDKGMKELAILPVNVISLQPPDKSTPVKFGSSTIRSWLAATQVKDTAAKKAPANHPSSLASK